MLFVDRGVGYDSNTIKAPNSMRLKIGMCDANIHTKSGLNAINCMY